MAGGEYLGFNNSIFLSERDSADRNNALAYFMRENNCFPPGDIKINDVLDFYFQVMMSFYNGAMLCAKCSYFLTPSPSVIVTITQPPFLSSAILVPLPSLIADVSRYRLMIVKKA